MNQVKQTIRDPIIKRNTIVFVNKQGKGEMYVSTPHFVTFSNLFTKYLFHVYICQALQSLAFIKLLSPTGY